MSGDGSSRGLQDRLAHHEHGSLPGGRFQRKPVIDRDERPEELRAAIARARSGDGEALRYLYVRFSGNVYGYALGLVRDEHEAEDITQQVFTRVMTAIVSYEERSVPFSAWLLRITYNLSIDHMRRRRTIPCDEPHAEDDRHEEERGREIAAALRQALAELPEQQREVIVLRHFAGLSPAEIAQRLGSSEDSVHGLHHRGRRRMRRTLAQLEVVPATAAG